MVRMSYPLSRRCVAKECRRVWQRAGLGDPGGSHRVSDFFLEHGLLQMMAAALPLGAGAVVPGTQG